METYYFGSWKGPRSELVWNKTVQRSSLEGKKPSSVRNCITHASYRRVVMFEITADKGTY